VVQTLSATRLAPLGELESEAGKARADD